MDFNYKVVYYIFINCSIALVSFSFSSGVIQDLKCTELDLPRWTLGSLRNKSLDLWPWNCLSSRYTDDSLHRLVSDSCPISVYDAVDKGYTGCVQYYFKNKTSSDFEDGFVENVFRHLAAGNHFAVLKYLIEERGFRIDEGDPKLLISVASGGNVDIMKYLIYEKNLTTTSSREKNALHAAAEKGNLEAVRFLVEVLDYNVNTSAKNHRGLTPAHFAALSSLPVLKYLIDEKGADLNAVSKKDETLLHLAALEGRLETIKYLVTVKRKFSYIDDMTDQGMAALHYASIGGSSRVTNRSFLDRMNTMLKSCLKVITHFGDVDVALISAGKNYGKAETKSNLNTVKYLIEERKAEIDNGDNESKTPLHLAAGMGNLDIVKYLVDEKATNISETDQSHKDALHLAAGMGNLEVVKYLVDEKKANFSRKDGRGKNALHWAAEMGNLDVVKYLVDEKKADIDATDRSGYDVLQLAVFQGNTDVVKYLVGEKKASIFTKNILGHDVLQLANLKGNLELLRYLVNENNITDVNYSKNIDGITLLQNAARNGYLDIVKFLGDEKNANVNSTDNGGYDALQLTAMNGHLDIVKYLAGEKNADVSSKNEYGSNALELAARYGYLDVVKYLVDEKGVNINGTNVWENSVSMGHLNVVKYLADEKKVDVNTKDNYGKNALHWAASTGRLEVVKYLVEEKNVDIYTKDKSGNDALQWAIKMNHPNVIEYLKRKKDGNSSAH